MMSTVAKEIGDIINKRRKELGNGGLFSQERLAKRLNTTFNLQGETFTQEKISMIERGITTVKLSSEMIEIIQQYFEISDETINRYKDELQSSKNKKKKI